MRVEEIIERTKNDLEMEVCSVHGEKATITIKENGGFRFGYCCELFKDRLIEVAHERMNQYTKDFLNS